MKFISKPEISFWVPIVSTAIVVSASWWSLSSRVDLLTQKLDLILQQQATTIIALQQRDEILESKYVSMQRQWGELSQRVTRLER